MLDSARHFQSVDEIKQLLDAMALHKLNTFHWHLTDDQGWRLQIRKYPKLTEVGGCRIPAGDGGIDPRTGKPKPYCGFYTQDQVRDIVRYAGARHITVVPEIDIPGHAQAAVAAYPRLGSVDGPTRVSSDWGVHHVPVQRRGRHLQVPRGRDGRSGRTVSRPLRPRRRRRSVQAAMAAIAARAGSACANSAWATRRELQGYFVKRMETLPRGAWPSPDRLGRDPRKRTAGRRDGDVVARHRRRHRGGAQGP